MMSSTYLAAFAATASAPVVAPVVVQEEHMTLGSVLDNLPTDPVSIFTILLLVGFFGWVLWAGRSKPDDGSSSRERAS